MAETQVHGIRFKVIGDTESAIQSLEKLEKTLGRLRNASSGKIDTGLSGSLKSAQSNIKKTNTLLGKLFSSIKRIAFYRAIRSALKAITDGFKEGLQNAYNFSQIVGYRLASTLDNLASKSLKMKNQMGAAFGELIMTLEPVIIQFINLITRAANAVAQFFAILGGRTTYLKAVDTMTQFGDAVGAAGAAAKEAMEYLAPFDELNVLPDDKNKGGGGGASTPDYSEMFEETEVSQKLQDFATSLKFAINDVIFDWKDLTWEQIAEKVVSGLITLAAFGTGLTLTGSLAGGLTFGLVGLALSLVLNTFIFDHDGVLDKEELRKTLELVGGAGIGFLIGGPGGALFTMSIVVALQMALGGNSITSWLVQNVINPIKRQWNDFVESNPRVCELFGWKKFEGLGPESHSTSSYTSTVKIKIELEKEKDSFWDLVDEVDGNTTSSPIFGEGSLILKKARELGQKIGQKIREGLGFKSGYALDETTALSLDAEVNVTGMNDKIPLRDKIINGVKAIFGIGQDKIPSGDKTISTIANFVSRKIGISTTFNSIANFIKRKTGISTTFNSIANFLKRKIGFSTWINMGASLIKRRIYSKLDRWITMGSTFVKKRIDYSRMGEWINMGANFVGKKVSSAFNRVIDMVANIIGRWAKGGLYANGMWHNIAQYASGGMPRGSQLFWAREKGPELVGTLGGHTAVLNNNQIVESVSAGVARAIAGIRFQMTGFQAVSTPETGEMDEELMYNAMLRALNDADVFPDEIDLDGAAVYRKMVQRNRAERARTGINPMMAS